MVYAQLELNEYTNRVLNVIKAKFGLRDKSQALNKFAQMYGEEIVDREFKAEYARELLQIIEEHEKKPNKRRMTIKDLDSM